MKRLMLAKRSPQPSNAIDNIENARATDSEASNDYVRVNFMSSLPGHSSNHMTETLLFSSFANSTLIICPGYPVMHHDFSRPAGPGPFTSADFQWQCEIAGKKVISGSSSALIWTTVEYIPSSISSCSIATRSQLLKVPAM